MSATENVLITPGEGGEKYTRTVKGVNAVEVEGTKTAGDVPVVQGDGSVEWNPQTVVGGITYKGQWDANANSPALASGVGSQGDLWIVSVAGTTNLDGITDWQLGDWALFNGTAWQKQDGSDLVSSVFGRTGAVVAVSGDYAGSEVTNDSAVTGATVTNALDTLDTGKAPSTHGIQHENGGADEISVAGLSGTLADPQTPSAHASTHENGGADEISVAGLSGQLADVQKAGGADTQIQVNDSGTLNGFSHLTYDAGTLAWGNGTTEAGKMEMSAPIPTVILKETDASVDEGNWLIESSNGTLDIRALDDAESTSGTAIAMTRSGYSVQTITLFGQANGPRLFNQPTGAEDTAIATTKYVDDSVTPPAGADTQIQFNNAGSFGASANLSWDGDILYVGEDDATSISKQIRMNTANNNIMMEAWRGADNNPWFQIQSGMGGSAWTGGIAFGQGGNSALDIKLYRTGIGTAAFEGEIVFNYAADDRDFIIQKNTSGNAYVYDAGDDTHTFATALRVADLNTGDNIITTDTNGEAQESGVKVETAPTGGSGFVVVEYASAPTSPSSGFVWMEAKDANTKTLNYYDGTDTYSVDLSK